ncbi:MAG: type IV secretion system protein [Candidatus Levybacteria bacterium]|nr:type IV secretion system protein [Candidatus Levybacteria bacterium]
MKLLSCVLSLILVYLFWTSPVNAQTLTPTQSPQENTLTETQTSGNGVLNSFFSGFDWVSSGLIFNTPSLLGETITLKDGTELSGISQYRTIFADIAIPLFVIIVSYIALSHITHDNSAQLRNFFKRLVFVVVLFIVTPGILTYSIQFINLLNEKIIAENAYNLATFVQTYVNSDDFKNVIGSSAPSPLAIFSVSTVLQLIVLVIAIGFFLIGFLYIVFQAMIRFISLLFLSVIFPLVLPFALSEKTENITNTYFRTWFTFLIQQPAFVLGFAIVSSILTSILSAHGGSMGTLFLFSGALIFLGGVNIFVGRIFGDGWSMVSSNAQSMVASGAMTGSVREVKRAAFSGRVVGVRSYAGTLIGRKIGLLPPKINQKGSSQNEQSSNDNTNYQYSGTSKKTGNDPRADFSRRYSRYSGTEEKENKRSSSAKKESKTEKSKPNVSQTEPYKTEKPRNQTTENKTVKRGNYISNFPNRMKEEDFSTKTNAKQPFKTFIRPEMKKTKRKDA